MNFLGLNLCRCRGERLAGRLVGDLEHPARGFAGRHILDQVATGQVRGISTEHLQHEFGGMRAVS